MYAKFRFLNDTTSATRNRTLVKAITDCYDGIGPANFDGYAGIDSDRSYFYSKDSSHWTFSGAGGPQSINGATGTTGLDWDTGATNGSKYTLKSTYDTGHVVYCDVRLRGNPDVAGVYGSTEAGTTLVCRNRYGTSIEDMQWGNSTNTNPLDADVRGQGVSHRYNREIHVFADQTKLVLAGSNTASADEREILAIVNFDRPSQMRYRDKVNPIADSNVPVCGWFITSGGGVTSADAVAYRDGGGNTSTWDNSGAKAPLIMFPGNIYNERTGDKLRNFGLHGHTTMSATACVLDDDVTQRPTAPPSIDPSTGYYTQYNQHRGWFAASEWGGLSANDPERRDAINGNAYDIDSNGNKSIRLSPTYFDFHSLGGDEVNMSSKAGIYTTVANAGFFGDSATIDGVKYQYFPLSSTNAMMIRRD